MVALIWPNAENCSLVELETAMKAAPTQQAYQLKVPQPRPDRQEEQARECFVKQLRTWLRDEDVELWFQDEMGVEGDPWPRRHWIENGQKGRVRGKRNLLIMDNADWHKIKSLKRGGFEPAYLPPYSPDLNPIERLWLLVKARWFADFVARDRTQLMARLDEALMWGIDRKDENQQTRSNKSEL